MMSVVLPAYNEGENIRYAAQEIGKVLKKAEIPYELLFVDDGSKDDTWEQIVIQNSLTPCVRGVSFSRNFGKEAAILAGLAYSKGDCVAVMDCDLQHPAQTLPQMYALWQQGYQVVEGIKASRGRENPIHRGFAKLFYGIQTQLSGIPMQDSSDFKLMDRCVVDVLNRLPEKNTFFRALSFWAGFRTTKLEYYVQERAHGTSKWNGAALVKYAINNITSFSSVPLQLITLLGTITLLAGGVLGVQTLVHWLTGNAVEGFTTVILLLLLIGGAIMMSLGIIGHYIAKIYDEIKGRPRYIVARETSVQTSQEQEQH